MYLMNPTHYPLLALLLVSCSCTALAGAGAGAARWTEHDYLVSSETGLDDPAVSGQ